MDQQSATEKVSVSLLRRVDDACRRFEDQWQAGQRPNLEPVLAAFPDPERGAALADLLPLEWNYRHRAGESFYPEEYGRRFPTLGAVVDEAWQGWTERRGPMPTAPLRPRRGR
jgi:hypothetical protein